VAALKTESTNSIGVGHGYSASENAANDTAHIDEVTPESFAGRAVNLRPQFFMIQAVLPACAGPRGFDYQYVSIYG